MTGPKRSRARSIIGDFFDQYSPAITHSLTAHEQAIVRSALEEFILDEWRLQQNVAYEAVKKAFVKLKQEAGKSSDLQPHIASAETACGQMAAILERYENALMMQQEHCVMLSEEVRQMRTRKRS